MKNIIGKTIHHIHKKTAALHTKFNFDKTAHIDYEIMGKRESIDTLQIDPAHLRIYIGAMEHKRDYNNQITYSDELIIGIVQFLKQHTPKQPVHIILGTPVSEIVNPQNSDKMTTATQIIYLNQLLEKHFPSSFVRKYIDISSVENTTHDTLFTLLRNKDLHTYKVAENEPLIATNYTSTDIFHYLLWLYHHGSKKFHKDIHKAKPGELKQYNDESNYYPLIEIAIRLTDYLQGTTIQGGVKRQTKYDTIITNLLNPQYPGYGKCRNLRNFTKTQQTDPFAALYFDTEKTTTAVHKEYTKSHLTQKIRNNILITTGLLTAALGGAKWNEYHNLQQMKSDTQKHITEVIEDKDIIQSYPMGYNSRLRTIEEKNEFIQKAISDSRTRYIELFMGDRSLSTKERIQLDNLIADILLRDNNFQKLAGLPAPITNFVIYKLVKDNELQLRNLGLSIDLMPQLKDKEQLIHQTFLQENDTSIHLSADNMWEPKNVQQKIKERNKNQIPLASRAGAIYKQKITYLLPYRIEYTETNGYDWSYHESGHLLSINKQHEKPFFITNGEYNHLTFSVQKAQKILTWYLYHTDDDIAKICDLYFMIYVKNISFTDYTQQKYTSSFGHFLHSIAPILVKDIVTNHITQQMQQYTKPKEYFIYNYFHTITKKYPDLHKKVPYNNFSHIPYQQIYQHQTSIINTLDRTHTDSILGNNFPRYIGINQRHNSSISIENTTFIGKYISTQGKEYELIVTDIEGKEYLYARDITDPYYSGGYYISTGEKVAQDIQSNIMPRRPTSNK